MKIGEHRSDMVQTWFFQGSNTRNHLFATEPFSTIRTVKTWLPLLMVSALVSTVCSVWRYLVVVAQRAVRDTPTHLAHIARGSTILSRQHSPSLSIVDEFNPFTPKSDSIDFTLSNTRRFYLSKGDPLGVKGLNMNCFIYTSRLFTPHWKIWTQ